MKTLYHETFNNNITNQIDVYFLHKMLCTESKENIIQYLNIVETHKLISPRACVRDYKYQIPFFR